MRVERKIKISEQQLGPTSRLSHLQDQTLGRSLGVARLVSFVDITQPPSIYLDGGHSSEPTAQVDRWKSLAAWPLGLR